MDETEILKRRIAELELALAQSRAQCDRLQALAFEDPLTGVLNRRGFQRELERAIAFRRRYDTPVAFLVFDLDGFKDINDRHGHAAGDAVLVAAADTLRTHTRASDTVARLGGDEFATLLWHVDAETAQRKGRSVVAALDATTVTVGEAVIKLTASFGVSPIGMDGDLAGAYDSADRALYRDKAERRRATR